MDHRYIWAPQLTVDNISFNVLFPIPRDVLLVRLQNYLLSYSSYESKFYSWIPDQKAHCASGSFSGIS